jgi:RND family efflux transporter MFP subunit
MFKIFDRVITFITSQLKYRRTWIGFAVILVVLFFVARGGVEPEAPTAETPLPQVYTGTVGAQAGQGSVLLIGLVEAKTQASLQAEVGGRVVSVPVSLGQTVTAGSVIAQLENASERAAVTQAQGAYEAALAGASQGNSGVREAEIQLEQAQTAYNAAVATAYTTLSSVVSGTIDDFFSDPTSSIPGLRVSGDTFSLNRDRVALQSELPKLQTALATLSPQTTDQVATEATAVATRMLGMVDSFYAIIVRDGERDQLHGAPLSSYATEVLAARTSLSGTITALENAKRSLASANESLDRIRVGGTDTNVSLANAQIKQALGALRSVEANLAKTIIRSPITGTVNSLSIRAGDFVSAGTPLAEIANNSGLEITTYINESEVPLFTVGTAVQINGVATGTVTNVAPAVEASTGKIEIRIGVGDSTLKPGDSVQIAGIVGNSVETASTLSVPLAAVKFDGADSFVFTLGDDNVLVRTPVEVGAVIGDNIVITSGVEARTVIVLDARGLTAGTMVVPVTK